MTTKPTASVIVCTARGGQPLHRAIESLLAQTRCDSFEIVVVDNGASDGTAESVRALREASSIPIVCLRHEEPGLSGARNAGIEAARGEILAFLDDDAVAAPAWLASLVDVLRRHPEADAAGGPVEPLGQFTVPDWVHPRLGSYISLANHGPRPKRLRYPHYPFGVNMVLRRSALNRVGLFDPRIGPRNVAGALSGDETDLFLRIETAGGAILYAPDALVYHEMHPERLAPSWFVARAGGIGLSFAVMDRKVLNAPQLAGRLLINAAHILAAVPIWVFATLLGQAKWRLYARCVLARASAYWRTALGISARTHPLAP